MRRSTIAAMALLAVAVSWADDTTPDAASASTASLHQSFEMRVPLPPTPVRIAGALVLRYELHLTNLARTPLRLTGLTVRDAAHGSDLADFPAPALAASVEHPASSVAPRDIALVAPGERVVAYVDLVRSGDDEALATLAHRVRYIVAAPGAATATYSVDGTRVDVATPRGAALGPPLPGGPWAAVYAPEMPRGHRRVLYTLDGVARVPGRHAIDWFRVDAAGRYARDGGKSAKDWLGYGADVLAVADARVADLRDGVAEDPRALAGGAMRNPLHLASGNFIALDLGDGRYAFYEHLRPGSVRVKPGDRVRRGDIIAALGYSGDTTGPHLHFHVADANATLAAEGLPHDIDAFEWLGQYESIAAFGAARPWSPRDDAQAAKRQDELPAANAVVRFPD